MTKRPPRMRNGLPKHILTALTQGSLDRTAIGQRFPQASSDGISQALVRLKNRGWATVTDGVFEPTPAGRMMLLPVADRKMAAVKHALADTHATPPKQLNATALVESIVLVLGLHTVETELDRIRARISRLTGSLNQ